MHGPPDPQKERSPDLLAQEGASGIEGLPRRVLRYGEAKRRALDLADCRQISAYAEAFRPGELDRVLNRVKGCGQFLDFRHYPDVDEVRLHRAFLCTKHLLCPLCAIRRGSKGLQAYLPRFEALRASDGLLRPFMVTLTVRDGPDLRERFLHLQRSQHELWKRKQRGRGSVLDGVAAAVWSYEVKRGSGSGLWHPHLHMVAVAHEQPDAEQLRTEWREITGDSFIVDVRPIDQADPASGFAEVFKYALKFSDMEPTDVLEAFAVLRGRRLIGSAGAFRGIEIPEQLTDEPLDDLPFIEYFYAWAGSGYRLTGRRASAPDPGQRLPRAPAWARLGRTKDGPPGVQGAAAPTSAERTVTPSG